ncbi:MAG: hypothetical protein CMF62_03240 [Magnetococcales bacterium]|nr:hypothetical protein [Magnetococcales bacterium]|tara:strand:- start:2123 stop:2674 length:552 start_codon:yes stop_codon:yes gene_type:complete
MELIDFFNKFGDFFKTHKNGMFLSGSFVIIMLMLWGFISTQLLHLFSFFYLLNKNMKLLNETTIDSTKQTSLLKWYASYTFFVISEYIGNIFLYFSPFYGIFTIVKFIFFMWMINNEHLESFFNLIVKPTYEVNKKYFDYIVDYSEVFVSELTNQFNTSFDSIKDNFFIQLAKYTAEAMKKDD